MQVDYIIVGLGLAGMAFAEMLEAHQKSYVVYDDQSQNSSLVAAGVYNPVILKRFSAVWDAEDQLRIAIPFYQKLEKKLAIKIDQAIDIYKLFHSVEEQNNWFHASDKPFFASYMIPEIIENTNKNINAPFGFGRLVKTGKIETAQLLKSYKEKLELTSKIRKESFVYDKIHFKKDEVIYKDIEAKKIIFCEGYGLISNPYFSYVKLKEAKGELLHIHAPKLKLESLLKAAVFIMPLGNDYYKVGATFNWKDKTSLPTVAGKKELTQKLDKIINCKYTIVEQLAGIRPTVHDRRPLLGQHHTHNQLGVLNGLGTRGVLLAPKMAMLLYRYLEYGEDLPKEIDIKRFVDKIGQG